MIVEVDNTTYYVYWKHGSSKVFDLVQNRKLSGTKTIKRYRRNTICSIREGNSKLDNENELSRGEAITHPNDNFSRSIGRKLSLQKAIAAFPREVRTAFWNKFLA